MAGSQKEFELLFKLQASLGGNFNGVFKSAIDTQNKLSNSMKTVNSIQSKVDGYTKASDAISKNKAKLTQLNAEHDRLQKELNETAEKKKALQRAMQTAETQGNIEEYKRLQTELNATDREYSRLNEKLKGNKNQIQQTTAKIEEQTGKLNGLEGELRAAGVNTDNLEGANTRLQRSYDRLKSSQQNLQRINEQQAKVKESISATKTQLLGTVGVIGAVAAAVYAGPVQAAVKYESSMAKVATIADLKAVPLEQLSSEIMQLSNTTGIASSAIAEDVYNAISAGQKTGDAVNFVANSTKLAKAGFAESSQTLDVLTTILNAYGMEASKVSTVSDMLVQTQNKGKVTVGELSSVMGKIIPTANANNVALEQLCAGYAIMTSKGIAAAETTTYMNSMLNELSKSGTTADKTLRAATGSSFKELMASGKSLGEVLDILQQQAQNSGKTINDMFGSAEAGKAAVSLLSDGVDGFNEQVQGMVDSAGATQAAFDTVAASTEEKMAKAKNSIANLGIVLGQNLLPIVGTIADKLAGVVTKVSEFAQANPKLVQTVLKVAGALAGLKVASLADKLDFLEIKNSVLGVKKVFAIFGANAAEVSAAGVGLGSKLRAAGKGITGYFSSVGSALGGVGKSFGKIFSSILAPIGNIGKTIGTKLLSGITGPLGAITGKLGGFGATILTKIASPFKAVGGIIGGALGNVGSIIAASPIGKIGSIIGKSLSGIGSYFAPIGKAISGVFAPLGKLGSSLLGPFSGIVGKILPIVGVITTVITVVKLLKDHFEEIREAVGRIFGEKGLEVFDKIVATITSVGDAIKNVFSDGNIGIARDKIQEIFGEKGVAVFDTFMNIVGSVKDTIGTLVNFIAANVVPVVEQVLQVLVNTVIPGIINGIQAAAPVVMQIFQSIADFIGGIIPIIGSFIAGIMPIISEVITFIQTYVLPIVQEVFNFIVTTVLPFIVQGIQELGSIITSVLSAVLPVVQTVFQTIWSIIQPILQQILSTVQAVLPSVLSVFRTVFQTIMSIIQSVSQVFSGLIQFIQGVFSGNWSQAWNGIKNIFQGAWDGLTSIVKGVINGIIGIINGAISALNSIKIPDWVPGVGGKGINIPTLPTFAKGTRNTPDTFIAGEEGPELITNAPGRVVYTAEQTKDIMQRQQQARTAMEATRAAQDVQNVSTVNNNQLQNYYNSVRNETTEVEPPQVPYGMGGGNTYVTINNNPTVVVEGDQPEDLEETLQRNNDDLLRKVEDLMDKKADDERRMQYD